MSDLVKLTDDAVFPIEYYSMGKTKVLSLDHAIKLRDGLSECINALIRQKDGGGGNQTPSSASGVS